MLAPHKKPATAAKESPGTLTASQRLADYAAAFSYEDIPPATRERAKLLILDAIGIAYTSTQYDFAHRVLTGLSALDEGGSSPLIGMPGKLALRDAVLMNGVLVHGLDYDDTHVRAILHPTASAFPCAFGVADRMDVSGEALLAAYILGVETAVRIADAAAGRFHDCGFHPTGIVAHFSCALQTGWLHGLTSRQMVMAQGLAGSTAAASQEFLEEGAWNKRLHPGWGAAAGITAAALAKAGFKGPTKPYEGRFGLFKSHMGAAEAGVNYNVMHESLGSIWEVDNVAIKPYPICHDIHAAADSALILLEKHAIDPAQIERVIVYAAESMLPIVAEPRDKKIRPSNDYQAKFSSQFVVAACLLRGRFTLAELHEETLRDADILQLAAKVECLPDPDTLHPQYFSGGVEIHMRDGRTFKHHEAVNRGAGDRALAAAEIENKFFDNALMAVSRQRAERIRDAVLTLETRTARELAQVLAG